MSFEINENISTVQDLYEVLGRIPKELREKFTIEALWDDGHEGGNIDHIAAFDFGDEWGVQLSVESN